MNVRCCSCVWPCRARLRTLMVTGDYHATALAVGRAVGMVPPSSRVIIIQSEKDTSPGNLPVSVEARKPLQRAQDPNAQEYVLQISGQGLSTARQSALSIADQASLSSDSCPLSHQATTPVTLREQEHQRQKAGRSLSLVKELSGGAAAQQSQQQASGLSLHPRQQPHDIPPCQRWQAMSSNQHRGLVFHVDDGSVHQDDALKALTALAQVKFYHFRLCAAGAYKLFLLCTVYCVTCSEELSHALNSLFVKQVLCNV